MRIKFKVKSYQPTYDKFILKKNKPMI